MVKKMLRSEGNLQQVGMGQLPNLDDVRWSGEGTPERVYIDPPALLTSPLPTTSASASIYLLA